MSIFSQDSQGNWVPVAGQSPVQSAQDGSYHFDKLLAGTYQIQVTDSPNFLDGHATAGTIGGVARGTAGQDQIVVQLGPGENGVNYNFGEDGLRVGLISRRLFLASTPSMAQVIETLLSQPVAAAAQSSAQTSPVSTPLAASAFDALAAIGRTERRADRIRDHSEPTVDPSCRCFVDWIYVLGRCNRVDLPLQRHQRRRRGRGDGKRRHFRRQPGCNGNRRVGAARWKLDLHSVTLTDAKGAGSDATATAKLDRSAMPSATPATAAADAVFGQQSWLNP